jgi:hypothetical protein
MFGCLLIVKARKKSIVVDTIKGIEKNEDYLDLFVKEASQELTKETPIL